jgi:hypothetical protein
MRTAAAAVKFNDPRDITLTAAAAGIGASTSDLAEYFLELVERTGALLSARPLS